MGIIIYIYFLPHLKFPFLKTNILWLCQVFIAALGIFTATYEIFNCGKRDLVPWLGIEPRPQAWERGALATGPPGKSLKLPLLNSNHPWGSGKRIQLTKFWLPPGFQGPPTAALSEVNLDSKDDLEGAGWWWRCLNLTRESALGQSSQDDSRPSFPCNSIVILTDTYFCRFFNFCSWDFYPFHKGELFNESQNGT